MDGTALHGDKGTSSPSGTTQAWHMLRPQILKASHKAVACLRYKRSRKCDVTVPAQAPTWDTPLLFYPVSSTRKAKASEVVFCTPGKDTAARNT